MEESAIQHVFHRANFRGIFQVHSPNSLAACPIEPLQEGIRQSVRQLLLGNDYPIFVFVHQSIDPLLKEQLFLLTAQ